MIPFNLPPITGDEKQFIINALERSQLSGDGFFSKKSQQWFEENLPCKKALLTTSCTHSLEMAAILINIKKGDEVIMPSYTFVSTANAFVLRGARIVFIDIRPDTQNMDETLIEQAITSNTRAIVSVHYAGVACEMDKIIDIASKYNLYVIEDAAQGMMSTYKGKALGTIGHIGAYSFHETKNYSSGGEGGLLVINDEELINRAEIIREKGTNRSLFFRGMVDKYTWVDIGSSYLMNDISAAFLWAQLTHAEEINRKRLEIFGRYEATFFRLCQKNNISIPFIPDYCKNNGHMFYIKMTNIEQRDAFINYMKKKQIMVVFHYIPLHSSAAGKKFGQFVGEDRYTSQVSDTLVRLPIFFNLADDEVDFILHCICEFFQ